METIVLTHVEDKDMDKWTGTWKPKDAGFYKLHYRCKIQDMYTDHPVSDDKEDLSVSGYNATLTVLEVDIEQDVTNTCWRQSLPSLNLTADSYAGPRGVEWTVSPATGLDVVSSIATNFVFCPSNSMPGEYVVKAYCTLLTICYDTCTVRVIKMEIEEPDGLPIQPLEANDSYFRLNPSYFERQFVPVDNEVVPYHATQPINVHFEPIPYAGFNWSVSNGTLTNSTTEMPTYIPDGTPVPMTIVTLQLKVIPISGSDVCLQTRTLEVYRDHLERDYQNWGTGIDCGANTYVYYWTFSRYGKSWKLLHTWNCFGSV